MSYGHAIDGFATGQDDKTIDMAFFLLSFLLFSRFPSQSIGFLGEWKARAATIDLLSYSPHSQLFLLSFPTSKILIDILYGQALQAAVQRIHTYVSSLEEKVEAMSKK